MKKFVLTVLTVLTCGALQALPAGNPAASSLYTNNFWFGDSSCDPCDPCSSWCDWFDIRLGFYGDYVYNRHLETKGTNGDAGGDIQDTQLFTNAGLIVVDICDWFEAFATVGVTDFHIRTDDSVWRVSGGASVMSELFFSTEMSYSGGLRATIWECDCFMIGGMAQYFYSNTSLDSFLEYAAGTQTYFNNNNRSANYQEWQVAIGAAYIFVNSANFMFVPYTNIEVAGVNWNLGRSFTANSVTEQLQSLNEKKVVGWSLGMSAVLCDLIGVTVEGRWANEKAIHVNGQLSF